MNNENNNNNILMPTNDCVFKRIFGQKGNEDITANFLEAVTGIKYKELNLDDTPILERDLIDNKMGVLDVKIIIDDWIDYYNNER